MFSPTLKDWTVAKGIPNGQCSKKVTFFGTVSGKQGGTQSQLHPDQGLVSLGLLLERLARSLTGEEKGPSDVGRRKRQGRASITEKSGSFVPSGLSRTFEELKEETPNGGSRTMMKKAALGCQGRYILFRRDD